MAVLHSLKSFFADRVSGFVAGAEPAHSLELASAALLMEISRADQGMSAVERVAISDAMRQVCHLSDAEIEALVEASGQAVEDAVSLYDFTRVINEHCTRAQKTRFVELLWRVAFSDRHLDRYEEYYVRKICDLIHVSHKDFIRAKHRAMQAARVDR